MWNIRNYTEDHRRSEGKLNGKKSEREKNHDRLLTLGNELRVVEGEVGGGGRGIKEGTYCMEHWVLYSNNESWNPTSKPNGVLYGD